VSREWEFKQIEACIAPNRVTIVFENTDDDLTSFLNWDLEKNLEDRQVQVSGKAFPRRGMNSPLNFCDGKNYFYDVEYSMAMSHFPVPQDYERIATNNEVTFSEGKDLVLMKTKEHGVKVYNSISQHQIRQLEVAIQDEQKLGKHGLPVTFTNWRTLDGSNVFHILSNNIKAL
jgi:hypothetical protein